jgi:hypothetical protein
MSPEARERSFDELAKGLAAGTVSRRKALRLMGAALFGGALASLPGAGWASHKGTPHGGGEGGGGGKSACAKYCRTLFGGDSAAQEECVSEGAHGAGPCYSCTPEAGAGPNFVAPSCPGSARFSDSNCQCEYCGSAGTVVGGVSQCCPADEGVTSASVCIGIHTGASTCCAPSEECDRSSGRCCESLCGETCCPEGQQCLLSEESHFYCG